ncbi:MAG: hypothetical protein IPN69_23735 [Acidobacteria bacterium]|nr:hypothetical protein [Acidobacteriota bacterium]
MTASLYMQGWSAERCFEVVPFDRILIMRLSEKSPRVRRFSVSGVLFEFRRVAYVGYNTKYDTEKRKKVVFKHYDQNQPMLLPPSLDDLVPANHPVRVVNEVIERIDIGVLSLGTKAAERRATIRGCF